MALAQAKNARGTPKRSHIPVHTLRVLPKKHPGVEAANNVQWATLEAAIR